MKSEIIKLYRQFRKQFPSCLVGRDAEMCLRAARVLDTFRQGESDGLLRIRAEHERESYFDVYGEPDTKEERQAIIDQINLCGCVCVIAEYFDGEQWQHADSVGMCIYDDPCSPFENCYVIDLMEEAVDKLAEIQSDAVCRG